jgi:lipopolysaccharide cholinephosphotransferase
MDNRLRKIQLLELEILKDIDTICEENDLKYYMVGGTLLGAVRHKGFIPWDDDVDIAMYRDDYNKIQKIIQDRFSEKYFVQNFDTDPNYTRYITKIKLNGTKLVHKGLAKVDSHHGIYVDIFPLDRVKKEDGLGLRLRGKLYRWLYAYKIMRINVNNDMKLWKKIIKVAFRWITFLVPNRFVNKVFDYICTKDNDNNCSYTTSFGSGFGWKRQLYKNDVFGNSVRLMFEGYKLRAPDKYETVLKRLYGDYMQLPPIEKRTTDHNFVEVDFGPYTDMINSKIR